MYRNKELRAGFFDLPVFRQSATGNDAVHVDMVLKLLVPGMKDLDDTGCCAEILFVRSQFKKSFGRASVKESVEEALVAVDKGVQFMWKGKDHMEIRGIHDLSPALIDPELRIDSLAVRAVAVPAGIVVYLNMAAVRTAGEIVTEFSGFTVADIQGSFPLDIRLKGSGIAEILIREVPDILNLSHGKLLRSGQTG